MNQHEQRELDRQPVRAPEGRIFEGGAQETVEILPDIDELTPEEREQGVIAGVGRDRVERRVREGQPPETMGGVSADRVREDALLDATYRIAGYFTLIIVAILLSIGVGWWVSLVLT